MAQKKSKNTSMKQFKHSLNEQNCTKKVTETGKVKKAKGEIVKINEKSKIIKKPKTEVSSLNKVSRKDVDDNTKLNVLLLKIQLLKIKMQLKDATKQLHNTKTARQYATTEVDTKKKCVKKCVKAPVKPVKKIVLRSSSLKTRANTKERLAKLGKNLSDEPSKPSKTTISKKLNVADKSKQARKPKQSRAEKMSSKAKVEVTPTSKREKLKQVDNSVAQGRHRSRALELDGTYPDKSSHNRVGQVCIQALN